MAPSLSSRFAILRCCLTLKTCEYYITKISRISHLHNLGFRRGLSNENVLANIKEEISTSPESLIISDNCITRLKAIQGDNEFLRISVDGGGCSGFQYTFTMDTDLQPDDHMVTKNEVRVVVDEVSLGYVKGATIDYSQELIRSSFKIVANPRAVQGCSCGASFAVKL